MSLKQAIEIREKETEIQRTSLPKLFAIGFSIFAVILGLTLMFIRSTYSKTEESNFSLVIIFFGLFFVYCNQKKNKRRIDILELDVLKLKRSVYESEK